MMRQLGILFFLLVLAYGKPVSYDQRQSGDLNFQAKLDNIMIVIATPGDKGPSSLFSDIASQILELRGLTSRNKKISVADEEIVEQGKDPLSLRILRIEDEEAKENVSQGRENSIQSGELKNEGILGNQSPLSETSKTEAINAIRYIKDKESKKEGIPSIIEKKISSTDQENLDDSGILEKFEKISPKETLTGIQNSVRLDEKIHEELISFGTIDEIDGSTGQIIDTKTRKPDSLKENKSEEESNNEKKILLEKSIPQISAIEGIVELEEKIPGKQKQIILEDLLIPQELKKEDKEEEKNTETSGRQENIPTVIQEKQLLPEKLENQEIIKQDNKGSSKIEDQAIILPNKEKKNEVQLEDKIVSENQRVMRELRFSQNDLSFSKSPMFLREELPRIDELKEEEVGDKNEVRLIADPASQLKPIGDMIENCGPGRIRNRYGICQFDEYFN